MLNYGHEVAIIHTIDIRTFIPDTGFILMSPKALIRRLNRLARQRNQRFEWRPDQGKGSHWVVYLGPNRAVVPMGVKTLKTGPLHAICKQLDIKVSEL